MRNKVYSFFFFKDFTKLIFAFGKKQWVGLEVYKQDEHWFTFQNKETTYPTI